MCLFTHQCRWSHWNVAGRPILPTTFTALRVERVQVIRCKPPCGTSTACRPNPHPLPPLIAFRPHPPQDVVYYFKPAKAVTVTASLCGSSALASTFDARLYLLAGVDGGGALKAAACSNDACGKLPALTVGVGEG